MGFCKKGLHCPELKHGTTSGRLNHGCKCELCMEAMREYARRWRKRNPEKAKASGKRSREALLAKDPEYFRKWYQNANKELIREKQRGTYNDRKARYHKQYSKDNKEYLTKYRANRRKTIENAPTPRSGFKWTKAEDEIVMRSDLTLIEMAFMVGRSLPSIVTRRWYLKNPEGEKQKAMRMQKA